MTIIYNNIKNIMEEQFAYEIKRVDEKVQILDFIVVWHNLTYAHFPQVPNRESSTNKVSNTSLHALHLD